MKKKYAYLAFLFTLVSAGASHQMHHSNGNVQKAVNQLSEFELYTPKPETEVPILKPTLLPLAETHPEHSHYQPIRAGRPPD